MAPLRAVPALVASGFAAAFLTLGGSAALASVSERPAQPRIAPDKISGGARVAFRGYSVRLPEARGWRLLPAGRFDLGLLAAKSATHSFGMTASALAVDRTFERPEAFLEYMRSRLRAEPDPARFSAVEIRAELAPGVAPHCVQARSRAHDHGGGGDPYLVLEVWNLTCLHPQVQGLAVSLVYYERYAPGEAPGAVRGPGRRFVESLRFEPGP